MPNGRQRYHNNDGTVAAGGFVYPFAAGTSNPKTAYRDSAGTDPHPHPIVLDAKGEAVIFWSGAYKVDVKQSDGTQVTGYPVDNLQSPLIPDNLSASVGAGLLGFLYANVYAAGTIGKWLKDLALATGSSFLGWAQSGGSATTRTVQDKLRETMSATDYNGIIADGVTDQTAKLVAWFTSLGADYTGVIRIPYNVKFNCTTVYAAIPPRVLVQDDSIINIANPSGYFPRATGLIDNCDTANTDTTFVHSSSHNANFTTENRGTAPTTSAAGRIAAWLWGTGRFQRGQPGIRSPGRAEFALIAGTGKWSWVIRRYLPWAAALNSEYWTANTVIAAGSYIISSPERVYMTVAGGTTGVVAPTHLSGTAVDGTVTWTFVSAQTDIVCFGTNENGELATNTAPAQGVVAYLKSNPDSGGVARLIVEASAINQRAHLNLQPTDGAGVAITAIPAIVGIEDGTLRMRISTLLRDLFIASDTLGLQLGVYGHVEATAVNLSATPSVLNCSLLLLANTGATNITNFLDSTTTQEVTLFFQNGNTTLVNGATLVLKGGINVTPISNQIIVIKKYSGSAAWFEKSRNF